jgi:hypothetical protein
MVLVRAQVLPIIANTKNNGQLKSFKKKTPPHSFMSERTSSFGKRTSNED